MKLFKALFACALLLISGTTLFASGSSPWKVTKSNDGRFTISMPDTATKSEETIQTETGDVILHFFMVEGKGEDPDNLVYLLDYTDYAESYTSYTADQVDEVLTNAMNGAASNVKGDIISKKDIKKNGYKGKEFFVNFEDEGLKAVIHCKIFLVKNRMYMLECIYDTKKSGNKSDAKFMDSFNFTL